MPIMPTKKEIEKLAEERAELIDETLTDFAQFLSGLQKWLYSSIFEEFSDKYMRAKTRAGLIKSVNRSDVFSKYYKKNVAEGGGFFLKSFLSIKDAIKNYYDLITGKSALSDTDKVYKSLLDSIGYDGDKFIKGGYLYNLLNDVTVERRVKAAAIQSIRAGKTLKEFSKDLQVLINGDKAAGRLGIVESHYYTNAGTAFSEFERAMSLELANKYGLNYAIWSGAKLKTTRSFCSAKKGKVFAREKIEAFDKSDWGGKIPGQSTLISCGGYNCVDSLLWITDELAQEYEIG